MQAKQQNHNKTPKPNPPPPPPLNVRETLTRVFLLTFLCSLFYLMPSLITNSINNPTSHCRPNAILFNFSSITSSSSTILDFQTHHTISLPSSNSTVSILEPNSFFFKFCDKKFIDYCPCHHDPPKQKDELLMRKMFYLERICPVRNKQTSRCLTPSPVGYRTPFPWPESKKFAWFENVPSKKLVIAKKVQNWVRLEGDRLVFPGGGTSFKMGANNYIDGIKRVIPLQSGSVRTVLDVGCGVASFGAALMDYDILTMSIAPRDRHEAQVQFALERGLPAMLGILSIHRLPYPSRSFDMVHCSRCLVPWTDYDGLYLMEIDRILRPGGYWVLSGPPISWKISYKGWERPMKELEQEQAALEDLAKRLCWKKITEKGAIAVWRKPTNHVHCIKMSKTWKFPHFCNATDSDDGWYRVMEPCITPLPKVKNIKGISGGALERWPRRLNVDPSPRIKSGISKEITVQTIYDDNKMWDHRVLHYGGILVSLPAGKYRNIMDMNARFGGFAAALSKYQVWVMNVVPFNAKPNTLGVIYDRGLIGTYMNWCEAFSTYPRTYDLIHADGIFSMYLDKCDIVDILFEMHRILRPKGAVIIRDNIDIIVKAKAIAERMRWNCKIQNSEHGPNHPEKILFVDNSVSMYP